MGVLVVGIVVTGVLVVARTGDETAAPTTTTTPLPPTTTSTTAPVTTTAAAGITARATTTTRPAGSVPGAVVVVAHSGGGYGEVQLDWNAVANATGYRVLCTDAGGGRARVVADFNITTGRTTAAPEVVNLWSSEHTYIPGGGRLTKADTSSSFQYVDVGEAGPRYYRVLAWNLAGDGPPSAVTWSSPPRGDPRSRVTTTPPDN